MSDFTERLDEATGLPSSPWTLWRRSPNLDPGTAVALSALTGDPYPELRGTHESCLASQMGRAADRHPVNNRWILSMALSITERNPAALLTEPACNELPYFTQFETFPALLQQAETAPVHFPLNEPGYTLVTAFAIALGELLTRSLQGLHVVTTQLYDDTTWHLYENTGLGWFDAITTARDLNT